MMSVANEFGSIRDVNSGGGLPRMTCVACRVVFAKPDLHREHYKSDWHRYNLKRKIVDLPPVTADQFQLKVLAHRDQVEKEANEAETDNSMHCEACQKYFQTTNSFENHLNSKKHKLLLLTVGEKRKPRTVKKSKPPVELVKSVDDDDSNWSDVSDDDSDNDDDDIDKTAMSLSAAHVDDSGWRLILPSGGTIGHRELMRYYRQKLRPIDSESNKRKVGGHDAARKALIGQYRSVGWTGTTGDMAVRQAKDMKIMKRLHAKQHMKLGMNGNRLFRFRGRGGDDKI